MFKHTFHRHAIETKNKILSFDFIYNLFITKFEAFRKYLNDNFKKEFIVFFSSFVDALLCTSKKIENLRLCVDYKNLIFITVKNRYFISLIEQLLNRLIKIAIFTKLNIRSAYNALRIWFDDEWKIVFRCKYEHFEYRVMFFELTNASTNFQSYIYLTLRNYLTIFCIVYLDDILIYSNDKETYTKHVRLTFQKLRKFKLFANLKKCFFDLNKIDYLEYLMSTMKIKINFVKV